MFMSDKISTDGKEISITLTEQIFDISERKENLCLTFKTTLKKCI